MDTDTALVAEAKKGNDPAFAALINRYRRLVFATAWALLQDFDEAEDAAQESFVRAYRCLNELEDPCKFAAWINSIARNVARKALRKRKIERARLSQLREDAESETVLEPSGNSGSSDRSDLPELKQALGVLSPDDRSVTTLFYLVGLDQERIASILDLPVGTVKSRLHRSRHKLRRRLLIMAKKTFETHGEASEDYGRAAIAGMRGVIHWAKLLQGEGLEGWRPTKGSDPKLFEQVWSRSGDAIIGEDRDIGDDCPRLITGDSSWRDYELSTLLTPISGGNAQIFFRISEDEHCWYLFDFLLGWQAVAISKVDHGHLTKLSVVNFPIEAGQEYDVQIAARETSLTSYIDGKLINQVTDSSYRSGAIALNVWYCKTAYRDLRYRSLH